MSTKAIREALDRLRILERRGDGEFGRIDAAENEVEAIERAAKVFAGYAVERYPTREALDNATRTMESIAKDAP